MQGKKLLARKNVALFLRRAVQCAGGCNKSIVPGDIYAAGMN
jgi:hypothetical protein